MTPSVFRSFSLFAALTLAACGGTSSPADAGDASADIAADTAATDSVTPGCPADLSTALDQPCSPEGMSCGSCTDPCQFCNIVRCQGGRWTNIEIAPGRCDAGTDAAPTDAAGEACGTMTCAPGRVCVHTESSGGPCQPVPDGGMCPSGTRSTGTCCVAFGESFHCADRPAGCDPLSCSACGAALCGNAPGDCPCRTATGARLECACLFP